MGQKIHPVGLRLGITRTWDSRWFEKKHYIDWLHEDVAIRKFFNKWQRSAGISKIEIERRANQANVIINTAKPGIIIGKRGVGIEDIRKSLEKLTGKGVKVSVMEIKHPELDARLVGQNIVDQLEKRIAFRRAMKQAIQRTMKAGAQGVKVQVSGRLGGAEIARTEWNKDGKIPLHTLRADVDYAHVEAFTTFGRIGVKVWVYRGEVLPNQPRNENRLDRNERGQQRRERGGRGGRGRDRAPQQPRVEGEAPVIPSEVSGANVPPVIPSEVSGANVPPVIPSEVSGANVVEGPAEASAPVDQASPAVVVPSFDAPHVDAAAQDETATTPAVETQAAPSFDAPHVDTVAQDDNASVEATQSSEVTE